MFHRLKKVSYIRKLLLSYDHFLVCELLRVDNFLRTFDFFHESENRITFGEKLENRWSNSQECIPYVTCDYEMLITQCVCTYNILFVGSECRRSILKNFAHVFQIQITLYTVYSNRQQLRTFIIVTNAEVL